MKLVRIECPKHIQELLFQSVNVSLEVEQEVIKGLKEYTNNKLIQLLFQYSKEHNVIPRIILDPYKLDECSNIPPW